MMVFRVFGCRLVRFALFCVKIEILALGRAHTVCIVCIYMRTTLFCGRALMYLFLLEKRLLLLLLLLPLGF